MLPNTPVTGVALYGDDGYAVSQADRLTLFSNRKSKTVLGHAAPINDLSADYDTIATCSSDGTARIYW